MTETLDVHELSAIIGFCGGILLGLAARMGRFCTLGAIEDATYGGSQIRVRMWAIALGLSIIFVHLLSYYGLINILESLYLSTCLLYTSPSPRDATLSRMPSSA